MSIKTERKRKNVRANCGNPMCDRCFETIVIEEKEIPPVKVKVPRVRKPKPAPVVVVEPVKRVSFADLMSRPVEKLQRDTDTFYEGTIEDTLHDVLSHHAILNERKR